MDPGGRGQPPIRWQILDGLPFSIITICDDMIFMDIGFNVPPGRRFRFDKFFSAHLLVTEIKAGHRPPADVQQRSEMAGLDAVGHGLEHFLQIPMRPIAFDGQPVVLPNHLFETWLQFTSQSVEVNLADAIDAADYHTLGGHRLRTPSEEG